MICGCDGENRAGYGNRKYASRGEGRIECTILNRMVQEGLSEM